MLDPSIIAGVRAPNFNELADSFGQGVQLRDLLTQSQIRRQQANEQQRQLNEAATLRSLTNKNTTMGPDGRVTTNRAGLLNSLSQAGMGQQALEAQGNFDAQDQAMIERKRKRDLEDIQDKIQTLQGATNKDDYANRVARLQRTGHDVSELPTPWEWTPEWHNGFLAQGMQAKDFLQQQLDAKKEANRVAEKVVDQGHQAATLAETGRHNRAMEGVDRTKAQNESYSPVQTDGGIVLLDKRRGTVKPATDANGNLLKPPPKPLTESQTNAALFARRMQQAMDDMKSLQKTGFNRASLLAGALDSRFVPNAVTPEALQAQQQAERNFINAVLRRESGAAIGAGEFASAEKQYFPRAGDDEKVLKQKAENRRIAFEGIKKAAGPAWGPDDTSDKDPLGLGL